MAAVTTPQSRRSRAPHPQPQHGRGYRSDSPARSPYLRHPHPDPAYPGLDQPERAEHWGVPEHPASPQAHYSQLAGWPSAHHREDPHSHPRDDPPGDPCEDDWDQDWGHEWGEDPGPDQTAAHWLPQLVQVRPRHITVDGDHVGVLAVTGYPHQVHPGWLDPLLAYPARVDVCLHIDPIPPPIAARRLRQQLARLESTRCLTADTGRLPDPLADAAAIDAHELLTRVARADTRLHRVGLYLTAHAQTPTELSELLDALGALASSMLIHARPSTYRALQAWSTTLPLGIDSLGQRRIMDTDALASTFPFSATDLPAADPVTATMASGVLYGHNLASHGLVIHDRFAAPNHNAVVLATSGAGKSYLAKLELLRSLYRGVEAIVIDPEDEYARLADAVGGAHIRLGAPGVRINPLDLPHTTPATGHPTTPPNAAAVHADATTTTGEPTGGAAGGSDALTRRALYLHTVLGVLLGELTAHERVIADRAIHTTYTRAGITYDPATWTRPAPLLADLADAFHSLDEPTASTLADRLTPYVSGSFSGLFDGPTTTAPTGHLVVFSLKDLPDELRGIGTLLALDATWRTVADPHSRRRRLVVVDEAWLLLHHPAGAAFLLRLAKSARKHWAGLTLVTQDAGDVLSTDLGRAVVSNAATHILLRTATQAAATITTEFGLSEAERSYLTSAPTGTGLLLTHTGHRIPFAAEASESEDELITTDPAQLADTAEHGAHHDRGEPPPPGPRRPHDAAPTAHPRPGWDHDGPDPL